MDVDVKLSNISLGLGRTVYHALCAARRQEVWGGEERERGDEREAREEIEGSRRRRSGPSFRAILAAELERRRAQDRRVARTIAARERRRLLRSIARAEERDAMSMSSMSISSVSSPGIVPRVGAAVSWLHRPLFTLRLSAPLVEASVGEDVEEGSRFHVNLNGAGSASEEGR